jgi:hypothetical protein
VGNVRNGSKEVVGNVSLGIIGFVLNVYILYVRNVILKLTVSLGFPRAVWTFVQNIMGG